MVVNNQGYRKHDQTPTTHFLLGIRTCPTTAPGLPHVKTKGLEDPAHHGFRIYRCPCCLPGEGSCSASFCHYSKVFLLFQSRVWLGLLFLNFGSNLTSESTPPLGSHPCCRKKQSQTQYFAHNQTCWTVTETCF